MMKTPLPKKWPVDPVKLQKFKDNYYIHNNNFTILNMNTQNEIIKIKSMAPLNNSIVVFFNMSNHDYSYLSSDIYSDDSKFILPDSNYISYINVVEKVKNLDSI